MVITARELADFEDIYEYVVSRRDFDMTPVQIESTRADLELARADFVRRRASVFNVEDRLIAEMNDAEINLAWVRPEFGSRRSSSGEPTTAVRPTISPVPSRTNVGPPSALLPNFDSGAYLELPRYRDGHFVLEKKARSDR